MPLFNMLWDNFSDKLWNKDEITGQGMILRSIYEFFGTVSDLNKSREVWFWEAR